MATVIHQSGDVMIRDEGRVMGVIIRTPFRRASGGTRECMVPAHDFMLESPEGCAEKAADAVVPVYIAFLESCGGTVDDCTEMKKGIVDTVLQNTFARDKGAVSSYYSVTPEAQEAVMQNRGRFKRVRVFHTGALPSMERK